MRRSLMTRRISAALLVFVSALLLVALAPLLSDFNPAYFGRGVLDVHALQADTIVVEKPLLLSVSPRVILTSGVVGQAPSAAGVGRNMSLTAAFIDVDLKGSGATGALGADLLHVFVSPLIDHITAFNIEQLSVRKSMLRFRWSEDKIATLQIQDATFNVRGKQLISAMGTFSYLSEVYSLDVQSGAPVERAADEDMRAGTRRPLQLTLQSPCISITFDGQADVADTVHLKGHAEVRTKDAGKLAAALGYRWADAPSGPALLVRGPARLAQGALTFGRSDVSLADQTGEGAISISFRHGRPRIEATLAFPALDVASLLQRGNPAPAHRPSWLAISTSFPAVAQLDAELRLSAARLQWNGGPVGRGAATVSAAGGKLYVDIAELVLGQHTGSLQFAIDHTVADAPVLLRGRFESSDAGPIGEQLFGTAPLRGRATTQFEIMGHGATLGTVLESASGRGSLVMREGQMLLDLAGLQRQITSVTNGERPAAWSSVAKISALDALETKFQLRDGSLTLEQFNAVSQGLVAAVSGRIGIAASNVDLSVRITPAGAARLGPSRSIEPPGRPTGKRDGISIRGPWTAPVIASAEVELTP